MPLRWRQAGLNLALVGWGQLSQRTRAAGFVLALFALTFKALLPPGFMVAPAHESPVAVIICTSHGAVEIPPPQGDEPGKPSDNQSNTAPCVCAPGVEFGAPLVSARLEAPRLAYRVVTHALNATSKPARDLAAPPPWPTGPPMSI